MRRTAVLALALAACLSAPAWADSPLKDAAAAVLPKPISLHELSGENTVSFQGETIPYQAMQLVMNMEKSGMVLTGYVFAAEMPSHYDATLSPYFRYGLTQDDYRGLSEVNKAFFDPASALHQSLLQSVSDWADAMVGGAGAHLVTKLSDLEPIRRVSGVKAVMYTAGARLFFSTENIVIPLYAKGFMYRDGDVYRGIMLLTPDENKRPLSYAMEDTVIRAAEDAAKRDRRAYFKKRAEAERAAVETTVSEKKK